jgi:LPS-assembly lipoprotein
MLYFYSKKLIRPSLLLALTMMLAACGFSLRSNEVISSSYSSLTLNLQQPNSEFGQQLRRSLLNSNVALSEIGDLQSSNEIPVLSVSAELVNIQPITVNPLARAAQYEIRLSVVVSLILDGETLMGPEDLSIQRVYLEDTDNITGNLEEAEVIQTEMRRELVNQVLRRMESVEVATVAN